MAHHPAHNTQLHHHNHSSSIRISWFVKLKIDCLRKPIGGGSSARSCSSSSSSDEDLNERPPPPQRRKFSCQTTQDLPSADGIGIVVVVVESQPDQPEQQVQQRETVGRSFAVAEPEQQQQQQQRQLAAAGEVEHVREEEQQPVEEQHPQRRLAVAEREKEEREGDDSRPAAATTTAASRRRSRVVIVPSGGGGSGGRSEGGGGEEGGIGDGTVGVVSGGGSGSVALAGLPTAESAERICTKRRSTRTATQRHSSVVAPVAVSEPHSGLVVQHQLGDASSPCRLRSSSSTSSIQSLRQQASVGTSDGHSLHHHHQHNRSARALDTSASNKDSVQHREDDAIERRAVADEPGARAAAA
ncbi:ras-interacting protein RIP3-like [Anopheles marshallii]|uniref:ras-interacting protein RIP3-like n=1 Tax=Anopheles marshallii TaxID=1521116 RepID=UPI00237B52CD|nr:ras-interacting protein RIP3-like [Anopheles marshallii]